MATSSASSSTKSGTSPQSQSPRLPPVSDKGEGAAIPVVATPDPIIALTASDGTPLGPLYLIREHAVVNHTISNDPRRHERKSSLTSVSFAGKGPSWSNPSGLKPKSAILRAKSPPRPSRFNRHVSFDNFTDGEPTRTNTIAFTLTVKHTGYQFKRRSRTFMVGIDEKDYSDIALQWMLEELVDDGDQIICLRVVDKDSKVLSDRNLERRQYKKEATDLMNHIQNMTDKDRSICIVLEFAVGKLQDTFQSMIQLWEPAMLVVGTKGRSLGGFQGLMANRNSFSKWCLQYSPIPVVVVRPTEKRAKKKSKRNADPNRQDYIKLLRDSGVTEHETGHNSTNDSFEALKDPAEEAHAVAAAVGIPEILESTLTNFQVGSPTASFDLASNKAAKEILYHKGSKNLSPNDQPFVTDSSLLPESTMVRQDSRESEDGESPIMSGEESSEDEDDDGEFEVISGQALLGNVSSEEQKKKDEDQKKKEKLHEMEMLEAAALANGRKGSVGSGDSGSSGSSPKDPAEEDDEEE